MRSTLRRMRHLRLAVALLVVASAGAVAKLSTESAAASAAAPATRCGVERWTVKTLQDRPHLAATQKTTVAFLDTRPAPPKLGAVRLERRIFTVTAQVTLVRPEDDGDLHLVLED